jgi:NhaA family Na+:H+ antiporter
LSELAEYLLRDEAISGKLILLATALALLAANSFLYSTYENFWQTKLSLGLGDWTLQKDLRHWVDEGLMAIFFLVVGLEIKRELVCGELRKVKTAVLPFAAALGGMIVPALIYIAFNHSGDTFPGWAIPMATDIAFAVAILALVGRGIPRSIRLFLLTLAIVDDIGAVIVIAVFYTANIRLTALVVTATVICLIVLLHRLDRLPLPLFVVLALVIWLLIDTSGVHASIAGVIIGLMAPLAAAGIKETSTARQPIAERLERVSIPIATLVVVPLFALANTGIPLSLSQFTNQGTAPIAAGIILGLVVGKSIGILGASYLMTWLGLAHLPSGARWRHMVGVSLLAGIGFTVSIFVSDLAFDSGQYVAVAKMSIFVASLIAGVLGYAVLRKSSKQAMFSK